MAVSKSLGSGVRPSPRPTTRTVGGEGEARALAHLQAAGLALVARNFKSPGRGGGEVDLIMREPDGTLVFVEVRRRSDARYGGAAASVGATKRGRIVFAARHYLMRLGREPACRFDVLTVQPSGLEWIKGAFDAG